MRSDCCNLRPWILIAIVLACLVLPLGALAQEDLDQGRIFSIQDRPYRMNHEFALSFGFMPLDAFYKMFSVNGHYVVHFDELWAWEAVHLSFSKYLSVDTGLKGELDSRWDVQPTDPEENRIDFTIDTNLMIKPMFGKAVLFDDSVIHSDTYFLVGLGAEKFETAWYPAIDFGVGIRIFIMESISTRLEVREYIHLGQEVGGTLVFALGFSYNAFADEPNVSYGAKSADTTGGQP